MEDSDIARISTQLGHMNLTEDEQAAIQARIESRKQKTSDSLTRTSSHTGQYQKIPTDKILCWSYPERFN